MNEQPEISVILPCQNEERALPFCLEQISQVIRKNGLSAEVIVSDSSSDRSPEITKKYNAVLVKHDKDGYGNAYLEAFPVSRGKYLFMADADGTYDFTEIPRFINELKKGNDLVLGNRFAGGMKKNSMPFLNRYFGNPLLSGILRLFFFASVKDSHTGMRAITKEALEKLNLQTTGMEFASEMIVKALKNHLKIVELPIAYHERKGVSKLRPLQDAWKHLRFMLLYSPLFLFFIPGAAFFIVGVIMMAWLYPASPKLFGVTLYYHPMFFASALIIIGYQLVIFALFAKSYAINHLGEQSEKMQKLYQYITIERASIGGILVLILGIILYAYIFARWAGSGFGSLNEIKDSIVGLTLIIFGAQTIFSSFMLSMLSIKEK